MTEGTKEIKSALNNDKTIKREKNTHTNTK
jgi:hypothetical protein